MSGECSAVSERRHEARVFPGSRHAVPELPAHYAAPAVCEINMSDSIPTRIVCGRILGLSVGVNAHHIAVAAKALTLL